MDCATKTGNIIHISGIVKAKVAVGISLQADIKPKEHFALPCLNYDSLGAKDYQCQINGVVATTGITIDASAAPYTFTRFDIWYCI